MKSDDCSCGLPYWEITGSRQANTVERIMAQTLISTNAAGDHQAQDEAWASRLSQHKDKVKFVTGNSLNVPQQAIESIAQQLDG